MKPDGLEDTIDGSQPRTEAARSVPVEVLAVVRDYPELLQVERSHYVVTRELARGGMGRVLEARDLRLGRQVAIKELLPKNRDIARRFEREARITARLQHPSIIHVYEAGVWQGGEPFYAMPVVPGRSLDKLVAEKTTLAERLALLPRVIAVADALAYAHSNNVIHRDLKPANVLVGEFGETVVIDWGLAKDLGVQTDPKESMALAVRATGEETVSGSVVGTPAYMPPEQARGDEAVDHRADVYSLGALLYKVLAGVAPYQGDTALDVIAQVKAGPPVPLAEREPDAPPDLLAIVSKAMARDPDDRYVTASELAQDLKRFETGQLVGAHRYTAGQLVRRWLRRHRIAVGVAVAAAAALAIIGVISVRNVVEARNRAEARRVALLEERGRGELLDGNAGQALAYLASAAHDGQIGGARGFLIAEAMRPFESEIITLTRGPSRALVAVSPDGKHIAIATGEHIELWRPTKLWMPVAPEHVLAQHGGANVLAFDAAGRELAAGGSDGTVRVWNVDGTLVRELAGAHAREVLDLEFAPDGRLATAGADGQAKIWDLASGTSVAAKCKTDEAVPGARTGSPLLTIRFDPLGFRAAAGAEDGTVCIWETVGGYVLTRVRGHGGPITALRWGPDASWIATTSEDRSARVWSTAFGKQIVTPIEHGRPVTAEEVSPDGSLLVTGDDEGTVRIVQIPEHLPTGEDGNTMIPPRAVTPLSRHTKRIVAIAFSRDGELFATAGTDRVTNVWETRSGQRVASFEQAEPITSIAFAGSRVVTGSEDGTARLWSSADVSSRPVMLDSSAQAIAVSTSGVVAVGRQDRIVEVLEPVHKTLEDHVDSVYAAAFTPDGRTLVTAGEDPQPIAWDVATWKSTKLEMIDKHDEAFRVIAVAADNEHFATAGPEVRLWSVKTGKSRVLDGRGGKIRALAYSPRGDLLVGADNERNLVTWNAQGEVTGTRALKMSVLSLTFSPDGTRLAIGGDAVAQVYPVERGAIGKTSVMTTDRPTGEIHSMTFACGGACLVTGGQNGIAQIWDAAKGKLLGMRDPHSGPISSLAVGDRGASLWIATEGKIVGKWDIHVESRRADWLERFMAEHVPWRLGQDDVVIRREGERDEQRGSDSK